MSEHVDAILWASGLALFAIIVFHLLPCQWGIGPHIWRTVHSERGPYQEKKETLPLGQCGQLVQERTLRREVCLCCCKERWKPDYRGWYLVERP